MFEKALKLLLVVPRYIRVHILNIQQALKTKKPGKARSSTSPKIEFRSLRRGGRSSISTVDLALATWHYPGRIQ